MSRYFGLNITLPLMEAVPEREGGKRSLTEGF